MYLGIELSKFKTFPIIQAQKIWKIWNLGMLEFPLYNPHPESLCIRDTSPRDFSIMTLIVCRGLVFKGASVCLG